jgi:hypothetical protein
MVVERGGVDQPVGNLFVRLWCLNMFDKDHIDAQTCASALK